MCMFQGCLKRGLLVTAGDPAVLEEMLPSLLQQLLHLVFAYVAFLLEEAEMH